MIGSNIEIVLLGAEHPSNFYDISSRVETVAVPDIIWIVESAYES